MDQFLTEEVCPGGTILSGVVLCAAGACDTNYTWLVTQTGGSAIVNGASGSTYLPGGSCTDVEFDLDVSIDSPAGTATMLFTATGEFGGTCRPSTTLSCSVSARISGSLGSPAQERSTDEASVLHRCRSFLGG